MAISSVEEMIASVAKKYLLSPSGTAQGINGFLFDINVQDEVVVEVEATDHYVEKNISIQDHAAHRPKTITLRGFVGELKDEYQNIAIGALTAAQGLGDIEGLAPEFSQQAAQAYSKVSGVASRIDSYISSVNTLSQLFDNASTAATKQKQAMDKLSEFADQDVLCTVQTPFGVFKDMLITRLVAVQREDTNIVSDFIVSLKEIRTVSSLSSDVVDISKTYTGRAISAMADPVDAGQVTGKNVSVTLFDENWTKLP